MRSPDGDPFLRQSRLRSPLQTTIVTRFCNPQLRRSGRTMNILRRSQLLTMSPRFLPSAFCLLLSTFCLLLFAARPAQAQVESVLYTPFSNSSNFTTNTFFPNGLIRDSAGNLYGTSVGGGSSTNCNSGCGTVFELAYNPASSSYTYKLGFTRRLR